MHTEVLQLSGKYFQLFSGVLENKYTVKYGNVHTISGHMTSTLPYPVTDQELEGMYLSRSVSLYIVWREGTISIG